MIPVFTGKGTESEPRLLYWEQYQFDRRQNDLKLSTLTYAGRWGDWKAVRSKPAGALELYNLRDDPSETRDVTADHPEITGKLEKLLKQAHVDPRPHNTGSFEFVR